MQKLTPANLPMDKLDIFEEHFDNALGTFAIVKKLQKTEEEYELFTKDYRDLHFNVRKIEKKIRKIGSCPFNSSCSNKFAWCNVL